MIEALWPQFRAVAATGEPAWPALVAALDPVLTPMASRQPIGRLRAHDDSPREIITRVLERLHARDFAAIRKLCALEPAPPLQAWLRVLVRRSAIDFMRESPEYVRANAAHDDRWISLATLTSFAPAQGPDSIADKRATLLSFVRAAKQRVDDEVRAHGDEAIGRVAIDWDIPRIHVRRLAQRGERYLHVLEAVLAGHSYPEVAVSLQVSRREIELTVHYLEEFLAARRFAEPPA